ncbi:MAG: mRNA surveillance protein pelota [Candidatus Diapherotrites archaeon]|nr:mRNA surveillance protein pelota [Candidatus Diapherotrites archaeon]
MKVLTINRKEQFFEVLPDSIEDLWVLERLIQEGDLCSGQTERKIKATQEGEKTVKKAVFIEVKAEKIEFHPDSASLRILGEITAGHPAELIEIKSHHTIEAEIGKKIKIKKEKLMQYHIELLEKAKKASMKEKILAVILDDEEAGLYTVSDYGTEKKALIKAEKQGKRFKAEEKGNKYFEEIIEKISQLESKKIIIAGPGFTRENLIKFMQNKKQKMQIINEPLNSIGKTGLTELIKSGKMKALEKEMELEKEALAVEELITEISRENKLAEYGLNEVKKAIEFGAGKKLLVLDELLLKNRKEMEEIINSAEQQKTPVIIVSVKTDAGKKLKGLSGIAALLRFKIQ